MSGASGLARLRIYMNIGVIDASAWEIGDNRQPEDGKRKRDESDSSSIRILPIVSQNIMNKRMQGLGGLAFALIAAGCALADVAPWVTAMSALAVGIDCLVLRPFGGWDDD